MTTLQMCSCCYDKDQSPKRWKIDVKEVKLQKSLHQHTSFKIFKSYTHPLSRRSNAYIKGESTCSWNFIPRSCVSLKNQRLKNHNQVHTFRISKDNSDSWFYNPQRFKIHTFVILCSKRTLRIISWFNFKKSKTKIESSSPKTMRKLWRLVSSHQLSSPTGSSNSFLQDKITRTSVITIYH